MKDLAWSQAYALAVGGLAVRRASWTTWLVLRRSLAFLGTAQSDRLVLNTDFGAADFFGLDWTDEPWADASGGVASQPPAGALPRTPAAAVPPVAAAGWSSPANPAGPTAVQPPPATIIGPEAAPASGGGGPPSRPPGAPAAGTPVVSVTLFSQPDDPAFRTDAVVGDGHSDNGHPARCYTGSPLNPLSPVPLVFTVAITGGPAGIGTLDVEVMGRHQLGTAYRGYSRGFQSAPVPISPGGSIECRALYTIAGLTALGTATFAFRGPCD